jgi:hypothetical protein
VSATFRGQAIVAAIMFASALAVPAGGGVAADDMNAWQMHQRNLEALFPLELVLNHARKGAIVEYAADCEGDFHPIPFPALRLESPVTMGADLATIKRMFHSEKGVSVSEDADGVISIRIGEVPDTLLQQRIKEIKFSPDEQYSQELALEGIYNSPEVDRVARALGIGAVNELGYFVQRTAPESAASPATAERRDDRARGEEGRGNLRWHRPLWILSVEAALQPRLPGRIQYGRNAPEPRFPRARGDYRRFARRTLIMQSRGDIAPNHPQAAGWNSSTTLPDGSCSSTCLPPGPERMSLRNGAPASRKRATSASMSSTMR